MSRTRGGRIVSQASGKSTESCFRWTGAASGALAVFVTLAAPAAVFAAAPQSAQEIGTVRQIYDGTLYPDIQVNTFRNIDRLFPTRTVKHGEHIYPLEKSDAPLKGVAFISKGKKYDLFDYLSLNRVSGLLVLKNGKIAFERYELGNNGSTHWMSMSMVKSISSTLVGVAIHDGYIKSIDDPVTKYLPILAGSAYDGVSVRNLLQMASGVKWDETYTNPASDRRRMLEAQLAGKPGSILELMRTLPRAGKPGTIWNYNTGETFVVGELIHAAVKRPVAEYLSERIWSRFGMESDATWWLESPDGQGRRQWSERLSPRLWPLRAFFHERRRGGRRKISPGRLDQRGNKQQNRRDQEGRLRLYVVDCGRRGESNPSRCVLRQRYFRTIDLYQSA
jgi:CubicO group peptidase (beta-lactamase class C family)